MELRKKALLSFAKNQKRLARVSNSSPSLHSIVENEQQSTKQRFIIRIHALSEDSCDSCDEEEQPCVVLRSRSKAENRYTFASSSLLSAGSRINGRFHLDTSLVRRVQTITSSLVDLAKDTPPTRPTQLLSTSRTTSTNGFSKKKSSETIAPYKRLILKQSMRVEKLKAVLQHRRKSEEEQKKSEASLRLVMARLKVKLRETNNLYNAAKMAASKAVAGKLAVMRQLVKAESELSRMSTAVQNLTKKNITNNTLSQAPHLPAPEKPVLSSSLETLTQFFESLLAELESSFCVSCPLFYNFNLFALSGSMPEEVEMTLASPEHVPTDSPVAATSFDPHNPICPFFIDGNCVDESCPFQHPGSATAVPMRSPLPLTTSHAAASISYTVGEDDNNTSLLCPVCSAHLVRNARPTPDACRSVLDWHTVFANCHDWSPFLAWREDEEVGPMNTIIYLKHLLYANLVSTTTPVDVAVAVLSRFNFPRVLFAFALTTEQLSSYGARRELIQKSLTYLLSLKHRTFADSVSCMNAIAVVVYHDCLLEWDTFRSVNGIFRLDQYLKPHTHIPRYHPARWVLWYIRALIELSPTFPRCLDYCPLISPDNLVARGSTLFHAADIDLGLSEKGLAQFLHECYRHEIPVTAFSYALSFGHLYVQFLAAQGRDRDGAFFCLDALTSSPEVLDHDHLFFSTAIHLSNKCLQRGETDVFDFVSDLTNHHSLQTSFAYCFAWLMQKANKPEPCSSLLSELVGGLVHLNSLDAASVYYAFRVLLNLADTHNLAVPSCDPKNRTYLWMGFGLFSMLHNLSSTLLPDLINRVMVSLGDFSAHDFPCPLVALLMHLGLALANMLPTAEEYSLAVEALVFPKSFTEDADFCADPPAWFLEAIQKVKVDKFSDEYPPNRILLRLLETYGFQALKSLLASGLLRCEKFDQSKVLWCLQGLCSIARLEKPKDEYFWLLIASLGSRFHPPAVDGGSAFRSYLFDCFSSAVSLVPHSCTLWRLFALVVRDCNFDQSTRTVVQKGAASVAFEIEKIVEDVFNAGRGKEVTNTLASPRVQSWWSARDAADSC